MFSYAILAIFYLAIAVALLLGGTSQASPWWAQPNPTNLTLYFQYGVPLLCVLPYLILTFTVPPHEYDPVKQDGEETGKKYGADTSKKTTVHRGVGKPGRLALIRMRGVAGLFACLCLAIVMETIREDYADVRGPVCQWALDKASELLYPLAIVFALMCWKPEKEHVCTGARYFLYVLIACALLLAAVGGHADAVNFNGFLLVFLSVACLLVSLYLPWTLHYANCGMSDREVKATNVEMQEGSEEDERGIY